ncbi:MAG: hypothetical protein AAFX06_15800, partial [Planctomycetota bacterium]
FLGVFVIGDAQGNHEQIQEIIRLDHAYLNDGRSLHYWIGFYNTIENNDFPIDTTAWTNGRLHLRAGLLVGCGMLLVMQLGAIVLCVRGCLFRRKDVAANRVAAAAVVASSMLWGIWLFSSAFLTSRPHYTAAYERLHWFVYWIAVVVVAMLLSVIVPRRSRRLIGAMIVVVVCVSSVLFRLGVETPLTQLRGFNSMLDQKQVGERERRAKWDAVSPSRTLEDLKPSFLRPDDRVLFVSRGATGDYWYVKQGVFWCDPYVEAFALAENGDAFLRDRSVFYALMDRQPVPGIEQWLWEKGVRVIVDREVGAARYYESLFGIELPSDTAKTSEPSMRVQASSIEPGIWRLHFLDPSDPKTSVAE